MLTSRVYELREFYAAMEKNAQRLRDRGVFNLPLRDSFVPRQPTDTSSVRESNDASGETDNTVGKVSMLPAESPTVEYTEPAVNSANEASSTVERVVSTMEGFVQARGDRAASTATTTVAAFNTATTASSAASTAGFAQAVVVESTENTVRNTPLGVSADSDAVTLVYQRNQRGQVRSELLNAMGRGVHGTFRLLGAPFRAFQSVVERNMEEIMELGFD